MNKYKVCVYAICLNEEKFVDRWYESMKEADEIVVLDTGSTDNTVEKLRSKGIKVEVGEKDTKIDVNIIVEYGTRIPDIAYEIQNRVKKAVENMTGLKVLEVNVHVQGVNTEFDKDSKKTED